MKADVSAGGSVRTCPTWALTTQGVSKPVQLVYCTHTPYLNPELLHGCPPQYAHTLPQS